MALGRHDIRRMACFVVDVIRSKVRTRGTARLGHRARAVPICQSTSFVFEDTEDAVDLFALQNSTVLT